MASKLTIFDIADKCGLPVSIVSDVLSGKSGVAEETRDVILEVARTLGYELDTNPVQHKKLNTLGLIVKTEPGILPPSNPFYSRIISGVDQACRDLGLNLLFSMLPVDADNKPHNIPNFLKSNLADGFLMVGAFLDETISAILDEWKVPIVLVDGYSDTERYDMVVSDNFRGSFKAVEHLIQHGHKHICLMGGETDCYPSLRERRNGYFEALKASGIKNTYSINFNINKANGVAELMELLQVNPQITAIFAVNDEVAVVAIHAIQRMGLRIPEDISVIGYDDTYLAGIVTPKLTTMHVDTVAMGQGAAHLVSLRLHHPAAKRMTLVTHPTLVERDSVARLCK